MSFTAAHARMLGVSQLPSVPAWAGKLVISPPGRWAQRLLGGRDSRAVVIALSAEHEPVSPLTRRQRELGYTPTIDMTEGMRRTEVWLRQAGII